jgi:DNA primase
VLLVEGVIDVHVLRAHGVESIAALGGTASSSDLFERLTDVGVERVVLALDNDPAGHAATRRSIDASMHASRSPDVWVIDPDLLDPAKDPGELITAGGADAWHRASAAPVCGVTWRALDLSGPIADVDDQFSRRVGFARSAAWLGCLPDRLAIEQTSALESVADSLGYDVAAVGRAFRARYWHREAAPEVSRARGFTR